MVKRVFKADKLAIKYADAVKNNPGQTKLTRREILDQADEVIDTEGSAVTINRDLDKINVTYLPSLHGIMTNTYAVIDSEVRRLLARSEAYGLDASQSRHLGTMTRALVQLATLQMGIKERSELEYMPDEKLKALADIATKRLKSNLKGDDDGE